MEVLGTSPVPVGSYLSQEKEGRTNGSACVCWVRVCQSTQDVMVLGGCASLNGTGAWVGLTRQAGRYPLRASTRFKCHAQVEVQVRQLRLRGLQHLNDGGGSRQRSITAQLGASGTGAPGHTALSESLPG
jgi:hypothetical protein